MIGLFYYYSIKFVNTIENISTLKIAKQVPKLFISIIEFAMYQYTVELQYLHDMCQKILSQLFTFYKNTKVGF